MKKTESNFEKLKPLQIAAADLLKVVDSTFADRIIIRGPKNTEEDHFGYKSSYCEYYNDSRTHTSLNKDSPNSRTVHVNGKIISIPLVGGIHHRYERRVA